MALQTKVIARLGDELTDTQAILSVEYDDVSMRLTGTTVENPTSRAVHVDVVKWSNGREYSRDFPAGQTSVLTIPGAPQAARIDITINENGWIMGASYLSRWVL